MENRIDEFLDKPCYVIDFLPKKVSETDKGHFFDVEYYLLNSEKRHEWDCLNLTAYNLSESMKEAAEKIALSEGFFCWRGEK